MRSGLVFVLATLGVLASGCPNEVTTGDDDGKGCSDTAPCAGNDVCQDGSCVAPCSDGSCAQGLCDLGTGRCVECLSTADCGGDGRVCNEFTGRCVEEVPGCTTDADCQGLICDTGKSACVQCIDDADCGLGARCDQVAQTCTVATTCSADSDCAPGLVCDPDGDVCVACFADVHCPSGVCDLVTNTCPAGCTDDDATEPNDGADAVAISSGGTHEGQICGGDLDEFLVVAEGRLGATLALDGGAVLTMKLENAGGSLVASATDAGDSLVLDVPGLAAGTYRVVVAGALSSSEGAYLLSVTVEAPDVCVDVDAEPNDNNGTALSLPVDGSLRSGSICAPDTDVWTFNAAAGDDLEIVTTAGADSAPLTVTLRNAGGTSVGTGSTITASDVAAGAYFVSVTASADGTYSLRATASAEPPVCMQIDSEPNNTDVQAVLLTPGATVNGSICAADVDQFRFAATALDDAQVTVSGSGVTAELVRASDGVVVGSGTSISAANLAAGGYRIVVRGTNAAIEGTYTVRVVLTAEPVPDPCLEGGVEPDETNARTLALDGTPLAGRICAGDTDHFGFELAFASTLTVTARFTDANGDLDMRLFDDADVQVDSALSVTDNEVIVEDLAAGSYEIRIFGYQGAVNTYTMEATLQGCTPEDAFEDNSDFSQPTPIGTTAVSAARCPGDDDFFALRLENGDALDVALTPTGGALTLSLVSSTGQLLQSDVANGASRRLQTTGLAAGRYLLRVTGSGAERVAYTLTPTITATPARCVDDGASPNETAAASFVLNGDGLLDGSYEIGSLVSCAIGDQDWFAVDLPAEKSVAVQLAFPPEFDVDVEMLEPRGDSGFTRTLSRSFATDTQDRVEGVINAAGRYFIKAVGFENVPVSYGVGIEINNLPNVPCVDDRFDTWTATSSGGTTTARNNDAAADAVVLSLGESFTAQRTCADDADWYKVNLAAGQAITIAVDYVHAFGADIDVRLYGPANQTTVLSTCTVSNNTTGTALSCASVGTDGSETLVTTAATAGDHFIEVYGFQSGENTYALTVE